MTSLAWPLAGVAAAGYLVLVAKQRVRGRAWPLVRTLAWLLGVAIVGAALAPGLMQAAHHDVRAHMWQHLLLGMYAPVPLVYAKPVTLLLRSLPHERARQAVSLLRSPPLRVLSSPWVAVTLNLGGLLVLYATPLYDAMAGSRLVHLAVHLHVFLAGYLFTHVVLSLEPSAVSAPFRTRLAALLAATALHATLSKAMYAYGLPAGTGQAVAEVQRAAQVMFYGGDAAEVLVAVLLFATNGAWRAWSSPLEAGASGPYGLRGRSLGSPRRHAARR